MNRGEVWWADLAPPIGRRPVLILTRSAAVRVRNQLVVALITRTVHHIKSEVSVGPSDGMPHQSVVNCDLLFTSAKLRVVRRVTTLTPAKLDEVHEALRFALELP
jgi:mRNA interferase MazF